MDENEKDKQYFENIKKTKVLMSKKRYF